MNPTKPMLASIPAIHRQTKPGLDFKLRTVPFSTTTANPGSLRRKDKFVFGKSSAKSATVSGGCGSTQSPSRAEMYNAHVLPICNRVGIPWDDSLPKTKCDGSGREFDRDDKWRRLGRERISQLYDQDCNMDRE
jgi:hypothetical protein